MFNPPAKYWKIKDQGSPESVEKLSLELNVSPVIANLLVQRGIYKANEAFAFFKPAVNQLHDPFLMKDMRKAVLRIESAINKNERILVYGDYDVDGTTSVAMMYLFLSKYHKNIDFYVPNRYNEGYGISLKGIDYADVEGISLIIALDCGIKAAEKVKYATAKGIDFIICDHHEPDLDIPKAIAVLDPKQVDCKYPFKELSGCGVGFKLLQAFGSHKNIPFEELIPFLDLVCVSIASDIVPIKGENRILAYCGLEQLNKNPRPGLAAIIKTAELEQKEIAVDDIVFKIGPRINAAGRMESGRSSVELLISDNEKDASTKGDLINRYNDDRKKKDLEITTDALKQIKENKDLIGKKTTVLYNPNWSKGIIGIVASRLIETYYRPTIILTDSNGFITGSARSVPGFDLYKALEKCNDLLETYGGHMYAAGLTLKKEALEPFQRKFEKVVAEDIEKEMLVQGIEVDAQLQLSDVTKEFYMQIKQFEPFGPENMRPVFFTENVFLDGSGKTVGKNSEHLKLNLISDDRYEALPCIAFGLGYMSTKLSKGVSFDICYCIDENSFRGNTTIQLRIKDLKFDSRK